MVMASCTASVRSRRQPVGKYLWGATFVVWWSSSSLNGIMFWGRPEEEHVRRVTAALDGELQSGVRSHASLIDVRRVSAVDLGAFTTLMQYVRSRRAPFAKVVRRQALLRPDGLAGAAVAGFYSVLSPATRSRSSPIPRRPCAGCT